MYLSELKIWNFRKYGMIGEDFASAQPGLSLSFNCRLNVLVGENDSGKTAIIDAIRYVLKTQSREPIYVEEKDFFQNEAGERSSEMKIECIFDGLSESDEGLFWEWLDFAEDGEKKKCFILRVWLYAKITDNSIIQRFSAGHEDDTPYMDSDAHNLLRVVYLKPLRDALTDMTHGYKSRLAQILGSHSKFKKIKDVNGKLISHQLEDDYKNLKNTVDNYFKDSGAGSEISNGINRFLQDYFLSVTDERQAVIQLTGGDLSEILRQLDLVLEGNKSGLGSLNLLCIAAELLLMNNQTKGLKLALVEELEAHLHPQYQLRLIDYISQEAKNEQFILTSHSITLASKVPLSSLIVVKGTEAYPMSFDKTLLKSADYGFLERFLDATRANLFFAQGLIFVEGDAENLLLPAIASVIDRPLHKYGVSVVNVGSTAFKHYIPIFKRSDGKIFDMPISIVTDLDVKALEYYVDKHIPVPKVWKMTDIKRTLVAISTNVEYINFPQYIYNKTELENLIKKNKTAAFFSVTSTIDEMKAVLEDEKSQVLNEESLEHLRLKIQHKKESTNDKKMKFFVPKKWTLEYDLACSCLYRELAVAVELAKKEKKIPDMVIDKAVIDETIVEIKIKFPEGHVLTLQDSYDIFKPLNDEDVSKAITAQYFAELLCPKIEGRTLGDDDKERYKQAFDNDLYLEYLRKSITNVTQE